MEQTITDLEAILKQKIEQDHEALRDAMYGHVEKDTKITISQKYKDMDSHVAELGKIIGHNEANNFAVLAYEQCMV